MPPPTHRATPQLFAAVPIDAICVLQATNRQKRLPGAVWHHFHAASAGPPATSNDLSGQRTAQKSSTKCDRLLGIDRAPYFLTAVCHICCRRDLLTGSVLHAVRRSLTLSSEPPAWVPRWTATSACCCGHGAACLVRMWSRRWVAAVHQQHGCARLRLYVRTCAPCWPPQTRCTPAVCPRWMYR